MDKVTAVEKSLKACLWGVVGLVPLFGLVPALYAIHCWQQVRAWERSEWNPAARYLSWGARCAFLGVLITLSLVLLLLWSLSLNLLQ
jgi:hypothetical protein